MAIRYLPRKVLRQKMKKKTVEKLVTQKLTINKAALKMVESLGLVSKKKIQDVALKVIKNYKKRYKKEMKEGASKKGALKESLNDKKNLVQRIQNVTLWEIAQDIKKEYRGEFYEWLPSDADEPDPEHQLNYGKVFQIGKGEMPGDRYGCKCGMNILVDETRLNL
jgi:hypothetical protein